MRGPHHALRSIMLVTLAVAGLGCPTAGPATTRVVWNRFADRSMPPAADKVLSHKAPSAPATERGTCVRRLQRVVSAEFLPAGMETHLIPLRDWALPLGNWPADRYPSGNCFLVRQERGNDMVQVQEGLGFVVVEIRHVDGSRVAPEGADLADYAVTAVPKWLAPTMKPRGEVERITDLDPAVATWLTNDVAEAADPTQSTFEACFAYSDGSFLRYEMAGWRKRGPRPGRPSPYTFGAAKAP